MEYALYKKSCTNSSGFVPVKSTGFPLFSVPLYLSAAFKYRKAVQCDCHYTLSKGGKHLSSLFQNRKGGPWYFGDTGNDALLILLDGVTMELFLFPDQRHLNEALYLGVDKLPLADVRRRAKPVNSGKFERQLFCYQGEQLKFIK